MPTPFSMVFCISSRSVAMRSVPSARASKVSRQRFSSCACKSAASEVPFFCEAKAAAAFPARAPKTRSSGSEFEPSRFAALVRPPRPSPCRKQSGKRGCAVNVRVHAAHHVMHHGANRNQFFDRVDIFIFQTEFANKGDFEVDQFLAEMPQVEVHEIAIRALQGSSHLCFLDESLRKAVPRPKFH